MSKNIISCFILCIVLFPLKLQAQFNPRSNTSAFETKLDTLKVKDKSTEVLNMKIYDEAYDKYLRMLRNKQRNWLKVTSGLYVTQAGISNWAAGGNNSFSGRATLNIEHRYTSPHFNVKSIFDAAYGLQSADGVTRKNEDYFKISSAPSWRLSPHWEISSSLIINSQFTTSYIPPADSIVASSFFAPGYITATLGIKYNNISKTVNFEFAPISGNLLMVLNKQLADQGRFGPAGKQYIPSFINYAKFHFKKENMIKGMVTVETTIESFWDYAFMPRMIAEAKVKFKFTKWLSADLYGKAIYDETIKTPSVTDGGRNYFQFFETIGFGLSYVFETKSHPAPPEEPRKKVKNRNRK